MAGRIGSFKRDYSFMHPKPVRRLRALDLFCCAGGASRGLQNVGFEVTGVDISVQPHYCGDVFIKGDALDLRVDWHRFDFIWASPPCQRYSNAQRLMKNEHPDLIAPTRALLEMVSKATKAPWVIENVVGAPLVNPIELCGGMFGLKVYRHRLFESNFQIDAPSHPEHVAPLRKMGRKPKQGDFMHVVGNFSGVEQAKAAMGINWMVRDELRESLPPAYSEFIGRAALAHIAAVKLSTE